MEADQPQPETVAEVLEGDCLRVLQSFNDRTFNLIVTSPPYADARRSAYGGISPECYVDWFLPRAEQFKRVLRPDGTFIVNIKERVVDGERHTYVMDLVKALRGQGWLWTEDWVWHKKTSTPGHWSNRFRDAWEHIFQFNLQRDFAMYQDEVRVPAADSTRLRMMNLGPNDKIRHESATGSGLGREMSNWAGRQMVFPSNVLHLAPECGNKGHPAAFPVALPEFFIRLFTVEGDWVLDPFVGSGTTSCAAKRLLRNSVGIDLVPAYCGAARQRLAQFNSNTNARTCEEVTLGKAVTV